MAEFVYILCTITSILCAFLLFRFYRQTHNRLLFWCGWCFVGLAFNNIFLMCDLVFYPDIDFSLGRGIPGLLGFSAILYGLIQDTTA